METTSIKMMAHTWMTVYGKSDAQS
jgi:hypothetical protein